jgi:hypothetical protein
LGVITLSGANTLVFPKNWLFPVDVTGNDPMFERKLPHFMTVLRATGRTVRVRREVVTVDAKDDMIVIKVQDKNLQAQNLLGHTLER